jgi:hypothetical protein
MFTYFLFLLLSDNQSLKILVKCISISKKITDFCRFKKMALYNVWKINADDLKMFRIFHYI